MSFLVARAVSPSRPGAPASQDRAEIFARGAAAVLAVADGAGGVGDGGAAADRVVDRVRVAVLDPSFELTSPPAWLRLYSEVDRSLVGLGETTAVVVVLVDGLMLHVEAGDSEAWLVRQDSVERLTEGASRIRLGTGRARPRAAVRGDLAGRLVVGTDGLFRHAPRGAIERVARESRFGAVADDLVALTRGEDDVAVLVAER